MQIQMLETRVGCPDGHVTRSYHKGCIYVVHETIPHTLACTFLNRKYAVEVSESIAPEAIRIIMDLSNIQIAKDMGII